MNIKKVLVASAFMVALVLGGCGQSSQFERVFDTTNNAEIVANSVNASELIEELDFGNQFTGLIFIGQEGNLTSELIANQLTEEENGLFDSFYFFNPSSRGNREELLDIFSQIGATVHWNDEGESELPDTELLILQNGFTVTRLSDFMNLDESLIDEEQIASGMRAMFDFVEMIGIMELNENAENAENAEEAEDLE